VTAGHAGNGWLDDTAGLAAGMDGHNTGPKDRDNTRHPIRTPLRISASVLVRSSFVATGAAPRNSSPLH
jgi:hypothetical protein